MAEKLRVGILFGGRSGEHEVSLVSARSVLNALDPEKYHITQIGISLTGAWMVGDDVLDALMTNDTSRLSTAGMFPDPARPQVFTIAAGEGGERIELFTELDLIFPVLHGTFGEDGTMQGLFELNGLAYVGAGVLGSSVGMDKALFKDVMIANQIPVVPSILVNREELNDITRLLDRMEKFGEYPLFVKPANQGSSVGVHK